MPTENIRYLIFNSLLNKHNKLKTINIVILTGSKIFCFSNIANIVPNPLVRDCAIRNENPILVIKISCSICI